MRKRVNAACYASMALLGIYLTVYQSVISELSSEHSVGPTAMGVIISLHFIGSIMAPVIFGEISDRVGKKPVVITAFIIIITGILSVYIFDNLYLTAVGIFVVGCGFAVIEGSLSGVLSDINADEIGKVINISQMFFSIGAVAGPLIALFLAEATGSWKSVFIVVIVLFCLIAVYMASLDFGEKKISDSKTKGLISAVLLKQSIFILLCLAMFLYVGAEEGIAFWLKSYFEEIFDSSSMGAFALSGYWASMIIGRFLASKFNNKYGLFLKAGLLLSLAASIIALLWKDNIVNIVCFIVLGLGFSAVWPIITSMTAERFPEYTGTAMGFMVTSGAVGGAAMPFLMGAAADGTSVATAFWIVPVTILAVLLNLIYILGKPNTSNSIDVSEGKER